MISDGCEAAVDVAEDLGALNRMAPTTQRAVVLPPSAGDKRVRWVAEPLGQRFSSAADSER